MNLIPVLIPGLLMGGGDSVEVVPDTEGLQYTMPDARLHYTVESQLLYATVPPSRLHHTVER